MTTTTLHASLQRSRFAQHALSTLATLVPFSLKAVKSAPPRSAAETAAIEAQNVRDMAYAYKKTDPGFAADLYAAAARHESQYEV